MTTFKHIDTLGAMIVISLIALDIFLWSAILSERHLSRTHDYFLDVGQGDGEIVIFPGNIKMMTDAGPDNKVLDSLGRVLPQGDRYIDIAIVSHPQFDHANGYNHLLDHGYRFGAFIYNGRDSGPGVASWPELLAKLAAKNIPLITLAAGDTIRSGQNEITMLSPNRDFGQSAELNDTGFVELVRTPEFRTLLTSDTGFNVENFLMKTRKDIRADVLKVAHHGSKYASDGAFLRNVNPKVAVIEVGAHNTYGHPSKETLARLASSTHATVFRTDLNGTAEIYADNGKLRVLLLYNKGK